MSEILTVASLKGGGGFMDWGRLSRAEIIKRTKDCARAEKDKWEKILAADDKDFNVRVVRGSQRQKLIEHL
jgi:hypothetical protein